MITHATYLSVIFLLIILIIALFRRARRYKAIAIHWHQAYLNNDSWSEIAFQYQRELRRVTAGKS